MNDQPNPFENAPIIHRYTRAQAIEDGVLVDLSEWARECGFTVPVACTAAVWNGYIVPADAFRGRGFGQSERGRGHDVVWMLRQAIRGLRGSGGAGDTVFFDVIFLQPPGRHVTVRLKSVCGPGDEGEPTVTIMLLDED